MLAESDPTRNRLLALLPPDSLARLQPAWQRVTLPVNHVLYQPMAPITTVYFPLTAVVSMLSLLQGKPAAGAALVGPEGMVGLPKFFGADSGVAYEVVQVPGNAISMRADDFSRLVAADATLRAVLGRYTEVNMAHLVQATACGLRHPVPERCANWLLTLHDRVDKSTVPLTHEVLGLLLGVRRESVTASAAALQRARLIRYHRGQITILDRAGLEDAACECYRVIADLTNRLLPRHT